jgi:RNA polymerase sigma factor (sigma-70 family)
LQHESGARDETRNRNENSTKLDSLTEREREVFRLVAEGQANKVIAADLGISERTVEVHRAKVMKKLDARNLAQLVRIYLELE